MARKSDIRLRRSNVANAVPGGADLNEGELAINTMDGALYFKKSDGTIITGHDNTIMSIDSTNSRVGIGTSSPSQKLEVAGNIQATGTRSISTLYDSNHYMRIEANSSGGILKGTDGGVITTLVRTYGDSYFNGGNVGIGTTSPGRKFTVQGASGDNLPLRIVGGSGTNHGSMEFQDPNTTANYKVTIGSKADDFYIQAGGVERARIDSSGRLLVGTTDIGLSSSNSSTGINLRPNSASAFARSGGTTLYLNRLSSDGEILALRKDGTTVGSIGTVSSGDLYIADGRNAGIKLDGGNNQVIPVNSAGAQLDNTLDLGKSDTRFKDLHLSGTINSTKYDIHNEGGGSLYQTDGYIRFANVNTETVRIDASGRLGIGTTSPDYALDIRDDTNIQLKLSSTTTTNNARMTYAINNVQKWNHGVQASDSSFTFYDIVTPSTPFKIEQGAANNTLVVDSNSRVGIGTSSPSTTLHIQNTSTNGEVMRLTTTGDDPDRHMYFQSDHIYGSGNMYFGTGAYVNLFRASSHRFYYGSSNTEAMRVHTNGFLGIGTQSPLDLIHLKSSSTDARQVIDGHTGFDAELKFAENGTVEYTIGHDAATSKFVIGTTNVDTNKRFTINSSGAITFNEAYTFPTSIGSAGQVLKVPTTGTSLIWGNASGGGGGSSIEDNDGDTKIQVEESADEDIIRFDIAGTQKMFLDSGELNLDGDLAVSGNLLIAGDINSTSVTNLDVTDKTITMANNSGSSTAADGAGIIIEGPSNNASLLWDHTNQYLEFSKEVFSPAGFVIGTTGTKVGKMYNSSGVMALEAYTTRQISFGNATNGEHVRIDATGNVGIGTTAPTDKLHVVGDQYLDGDLVIKSPGVGNAMSILQSTSGNVVAKMGESAVGHGFLTLYEVSVGDVIKFDANANSFINRGNVGIGTSSPAQKLHVAGGQARFDDHISVQPTKKLFLDGGNDTYIDEVAANTIAFHNGGAERMRIALGNVGIGTTNPNAKLHIGPDSLVSGYTPDRSTLAISDITNGGQLIIRGQSPRIWFDATGGGNAELFLDGSKLNILSGTPTSTGSSRFYIKADGNVGIGDDSPDFKLSIRTPAIPSGSTYAWPLDLSRTNTDNRGLSFGVGASGGPHAIGAHNGDIGIGQTYGTDSNGLPQFYETLSIVHDGTASVGKVGIGTSTPNTKLHVYDNVNRTSTKVQNNNHTAIFEAYGNATAIDTDASNGIILRISGSNKVHLDNNGNFGVDVIDPKAKFQVEEYGIDTTTTSTTATTQVAIHSFPIANFRSARFTIQITNTTDSTYHSTEILAIHDDTTANITEFGEVHTGSSVEATFDADISSGNFRLLATPTSTNSMAFKVVCHSLTV